MNYVACALLFLLATVAAVTACVDTHPSDEIPVELS